MRVFYATKKQYVVESETVFTKSIQAKIIQAKSMQLNGRAF